MAKYIGPKSKIARRFGEAIFGGQSFVQEKLPSWTAWQ